MKTKLLNFFEALAGEWVTEKFIKPGIVSHRSTVQGLLYLAPLGIAYLHSGEQVINLLSSTGKLLLGIADGTADNTAIQTGTVQLTCVVAILKAWLTRDPQTIETAGIPTAKQA